MMENANICTKSDYFYIYILYWIRCALLSAIIIIEANKHEWQSSNRKYVYAWDDLMCSLLNATSCNSLQFLHLIYPKPWSFVNFLNLVRMNVSTLPRPSYVIRSSNKCKYTTKFDCIFTDWRRFRWSFAVAIVVASHRMPLTEIKIIAFGKHNQ